MKSHFFAHDIQSFDSPLQKVKDLLLTPKVILKDNRSESPNHERLLRFDLGSNGSRWRRVFRDGDHRHGHCEAHTEKRVTSEGPGQSEDCCMLNAAHAVWGLMLTLYNRKPWTRTEGTNLGRMLAPNMILSRYITCTFWNPTQAGSVTIEFRFPKWIHVI